MPQLQNFRRKKPPETRTLDIWTISKDPSVGEKEVEWTSQKRNALAVHQSALSLHCLPPLKQICKKTKHAVFAVQCSSETVLLFLAFSLYGLARNTNGPADRPPCSFASGPHRPGRCLSHLHLGACVAWRDGRGCSRFAPARWPLIQAKKAGILLG